MQFRLLLIAFMLVTSIFTVEVANAQIEAIVDLGEVSGRPGELVEVPATYTALTTNNSEVLSTVVTLAYPLLLGTQAELTPICPSADFIATGLVGSCTRCLAGNNTAPCDGTDSVVMEFANNPPTQIPDGLLGSLPVHIDEAAERGTTAVSAISSAGNRGIDDQPGSVTVAYSSINVIKTVINDNGGTAVASQWPMTVSAVNPSSTGFPGAEDPGVRVIVDAGDYSVDEGAGPANYTKTLGGNCIGNIAADTDVTCTITNDDDAPTLTLVKEVDGGDAVATDWVLTADGAIDGNDISGAGGASGEVIVDTFALSESAGPAGYTPSAWVCVGGTQVDASISLTLGQTATCTIINTADAVDTTLTLVKVVDGGDAVATDWVLTADGTDDNDLSGAGGASGVVLPDTFALSEDAGPAGYTPSAWVCEGGTQVDASITLTEGQSATCTITNTADTEDTTLTLVKVVDGGDAVATDWVLTADGTDDNDLSGAGGASGVVLPDTFALSEDAGPAGYTPSAWVCVGGTQVDASITLTEGQSATCTITNTADTEETTLTLVKVVDGGDAVATDWVLTADGTDDNDLSGAGGASGVVLPDTFALSEDAGPAGYTPSAWVCVGGTQVDASITLTEGQSATCTITNTADTEDTTLTLVKVVDGGDAVATDWVLTADGTDDNDLSGAGGASGVVLPDTFALSEDAGPAGYTPSAWVCVGGTQVDASITLTEGQSATCTITNTADTEDTTLTLVKVVDGGDAVATDWVLTADGTDDNDLSGAGGASGVVLPDTFALSEDAGPAGYTPSAWVCVGGTQVDASITLTEGQSATCTITNTADTDDTTLTLVKVVVGGDAVATDWVLTADGTDDNDLSGAGGASGVVLPDTFALSEDAGPAGYTPSAWVCVGGTQVDASITLTEGQSATCTITNTADAAESVLTLVKEVIGGDAVATDWVLTADGTDDNDLSGAGGASGVVLPDTFALSESDGPDLYAPSPWICVGGTQVDASITLAEGESATCTITNVDVTPSLTLVKEVVGGDAVATDWILTADGTDDNDLSGAGGASGDVLPDTFALSESVGPDGYNPSDWVCTGDGIQNGAEITLMAGDTATCTITNTALVAMTLVKTADVEVFEDVGDVINYNYLITSVGVGDVIGPITVVDDKTTVDCPVVVTLAPDEFIECTSTYVVVIGDLEAGKVTNTAQAFAENTESDQESLTVLYLIVPIPTLGQWALILLTLLLGTLGMNAIRRRV